MAADPQDLTAVATVKTLLGISASTWDTLLQTLITAASVYIAQHCNRVFAAGTPPADVTEYHHGGPRVIQLKQYPIKSITSLSYASGPYNARTWNAFDPASHYIKDDQTGEIHFDFPVPKGVLNIRAIYQGGYDLAGTGANLTPADLNLACQKLVAKEFLRRSSQGVLNENVGGASVSWSEDMDPLIEATLGYYKTLSI